MSRFEKASYQHYGLTVYKVGSQEWAVGDDNKRDAKGRTRVDRAARRAVIDSLWAFKTSFIIGFLARNRKSLRNLGSSDGFEKALKSMQEKLCEDAQPLIRVLIGPHIDAFVKEAISADGRGHFLSSYDSEEYDSDDIDGLPKGRIAFRLN